MKKLFFLVMPSFFAFAVLGNEHLRIICSGLDENLGRASVQIHKIWHHLEPGMEPPTTYKISYQYIGTNSVGNWNEAGSGVDDSKIFSDQEAKAAFHNDGYFAIENHNHSVPNYFSFRLDLLTNNASIVFNCGKTTYFSVLLTCTGRF